jgi:hypothetical protein
MSTEARKHGQAARREQRRRGKLYTEQFVKRLAIFNECLQPKPRWMPRKMWQWWASTVIDLEQFERRINQQDIEDNVT